MDSVSDSDSDSVIERVSSVKSTPESFDVVPADKDYQLRLFGSGFSSRGTKLVFHLSKNKELPYVTKTITKKGRGLDLTFSKYLTPSVGGFNCQFKDDWWIFSEGLESTPGTVGDSKRDDAATKELDALLDDPSNYEVEVTPTKPCKSSTSEPSARTPSTTASSSSQANKSPTVHQNPAWCHSLKRDFKKVVITPCSSRARDAVENDEYIEDDQEFDKVRHELLNSLMADLRKTFLNIRNPFKCEMLELATHLSHVYPNMFCSCEGEGGRRSIPEYKKQAQLMCDRYREKKKQILEKIKRSNVEKISDEEPEPKKGKEKEIYGIDSATWHVKKKVSTQARLAISKSHEERDYVKREETFTLYRDDLCVEFRAIATKKTPICDCCKGFFEDPRHVAEHFYHLTGKTQPPLDQNIRDNLQKFLDHLEIFLKDADRSVESRKRLSEIELVCETEMQGSRTLRDIHILRWGCEYFDNGSASQLIRMSSSTWMDSDPPSEDSSPFLLAVYQTGGTGTFIFELWAEQNKLLGNMDMVTALAAFYHLAFSFDLHYPKEGQTVADLIQRIVCKYGDTSGTKTWKRRDTAEKKRELFCSKVYRLTN